MTKVPSPIGAVAWAMDNSNIDSVLMGGTFLKRGGKLLNHELNQMQAQVNQARQHVLGAVPA